MLKTSSSLSYLRGSEHLFCLRFLLTFSLSYLRGSEQVIQESIAFIPSLSYLRGSEHAVLIYPFSMAL